MIRGMKANRYQDRWSGQIDTPQSVPSYPGTGETEPPTQDLPAHPQPSLHNHPSAAVWGINAHAPAAHQGESTTHHRIMKIEVLDTVHGEPSGRLRTCLSRSR